MERIFQTPGIWYRHAMFLSESIKEQANDAGLDWIGHDEAQLNAAGQRYARRLKEVVDAELRATTARTHPRRTRAGTSARLGGSTGDERRGRE